MTGVLIGFGIIAFVIAVGYVMARFGIGGPSAGFVLNRVAFFVASPALLFTVLVKADLRDVFSTNLLVAGVASVVAGLTFIVVSRLFFPRSIAETTIGALGAGYANANNIGLPVAVYVLGSAALVAPLLLIQLIVFAPVALAILEIASHGRSSARAMLLQPVRNPIILASLIAVVIDFAGWRVPEIVLQPLELLGGAAVPMVLLAFGISLRGARPLRAAHERAPIIAASVGKVVVMPVVAFLLGLLLGMHGHALFSVVALAALPTAQNVFNYASRYQQGTALARDTVLITSIAAVPALLVIAWLFA
ncbi:AEC family transporter [Humibacter sp. RRB41]|uniref:AEC family transporter n=1 Tax=Humibacter sp. RRB41 TaxID=2919946 RepID=UPI001FAAB775|nr:AEC family transporter [Humibacter sp. RRB41]